MDSAFAEDQTLVRPYIITSWMSMYVQQLIFRAGGQYTYVLPL